MNAYNSLYLAGVEQLINSSFLQQIMVTDKVDVQSEPIYDTITVAAAAALSNSNNVFFTNVGAGSNKTLADTNMTQSGLLPAPEAFSIWAFRMKNAENLLITDALALYNGFAFEFEMIQKKYQTGPLWNYNAGAGVWGASLFQPATVPTGVGLNTAIVANGQPGRHAMHTLALRLPIENQTRFRGFLTGNSYTFSAAGAGGTGLRLTCLLDGLHARVIQ
jgi:hypothetical protein